MATFILIISYLRKQRKREVARHDLKDSMNCGFLLSA
jgi:preprotein translocase subunit YajC